MRQPLRKTNTEPYTEKGMLSAHEGGLSPKMKLIFKRRVALHVYAPFRIYMHSPAFLLDALQKFFSYLHTILVNTASLLCRNQH